ncbi:MAG: tetratricopeptide repeat protein [Deltaproteobacteria bacterium]|nr:tetratricopeptide repeat protein [Deltaproteobacteria bacterium]
MLIRRFHLPVAVAIVLAFACSALAESPVDGRAKLGIYVEHKGMYGYSTDDVAECVVKVFEDHPAATIERIAKPEKMDRYSLYKVAKEKGLDRLLVMELRGGNPPLVLTLGVSGKSFSTEYASRPVDGGAGRACDAASWTVQEFLDRDSIPAAKMAMEQSARAFQSGNTDLALGHLATAVNADPSDTHPIRRIAWIYQASGDLETALLWFRQATEMQYADAGTFSEAAMCAFAANDEELAYRYLELAVAAGARSPFYYLMLGRWHYRNGNYGSAAEALLDAQRLDPRGFNEYAGLVESLVQEERFAEAATFQAKAEAAAPTFEGQLALAGYHEKAEDFGRAAEVLRRLVEASPGDPELRKRLGAAYERAGKIEEAEKILATALEESPNDADVWRIVGSLRYRKKDYAGAIAAFQTARGLTSADPDTLRLEAMAREMAGDIDGAFAAYADAIDAESGVKESDVARFLAFAKKHNRLGSAVDAVRRALPYKDQDDRRTMVMAVGGRLVQDGDFDSAISLYESSLGSLGRYSPPMVALGDLYLKRGEWTKAAGVLMQATSMFSDAKVALFAASRFHEAKQWEHAKSFYNYSFGISSQNSLCVAGLAEVSLYLKDNPDLVNYYFNEAHPLQKTRAIEEKLRFLQIVWGFWTDRADYAGEYIRYSLKDPPVTNPAPDLADWKAWIGENLPETHRATALAVAEFFERKTTADAFRAAHPEYK